MELELQKNQILEQTNLFMEMMDFIDYTSKKYNDNKEQQLSRIEGLFTDCILKPVSKATFIDLTRDKINSDDQYGCREKMIYINQSHNIKSTTIGTVFLIKYYVNQLDIDKAYEECNAYKNNKILVKSTKLNKYEFFDIQNEDLVTLLSEYVQANIKLFKKVRLKTKLTQPVVKKYIDLVA